MSQIPFSSLSSFCLLSDVGSIRFMKFSAFCWLSDFSSIRFMKFSVVIRDLETKKYPVGSLDLVYYFVLGELRDILHGVCNLCWVDVSTWNFFVFERIFTKISENYIVYTAVKMETYTISTALTRVASEICNVLLHEVCNLCQVDVIIWNLVVCKRIFTKIYENDMRRTLGAMVEYDISSSWTAVVLKIRNDVLSHGACNLCWLDVNTWNFVVCERILTRISKNDMVYTAVKMDKYTISTAWTRAALAIRNVLLHEVCNSCRVDVIIWNLVVCKRIFTKIYENDIRRTLGAMMEYDISSAWTTLVLEIRDNEITAWTGLVLEIIQHMNEGFQAPRVPKIPHARNGAELTFYLTLVIVLDRRNSWSLRWGGPMRVSNPTPSDGLFPDRQGGIEDDDVGMEKYNEMALMFELARTPRGQGGGATVVLFAPTKLCLVTNDETLVINLRGNLVDVYLMIGFRMQFDWAPKPSSTDGEAENPGPRLRRRGPRSDTAKARRLGRQNVGVEEIFSIGEENFLILHLNIRGWATHHTELTAILLMRKKLPDVVCVSETWLQRTVGTIPFEGYTLITRRDRCNGEGFGGGVVIFARDGIAKNVTALEPSKNTECCWALLHSNHGPFLVGCWYRPPMRGELDSIKEFVNDLEVHRELALGTIIMGDMNVHNTRWLKFSTCLSPEGTLLESKCHEHGLTQCVREPTRQGNLLDLILTDLANPKTAVNPGVNFDDHRTTEISIKLAVPETAVVQRDLWNFKTADWEKIQDDITETNWAAMNSMGADTAAEFLTTTLLQYMGSSVTKKKSKETKSTHPWLTPHVCELVQAKQEASGTANQAQAAVACSTGILQEFREYEQRTRQELLDMKSGSKAWWTKSKELLQQQTKASGIPALRDDDGNWVRDANAKADLLQKTFQDKCRLPEVQTNKFSDTAIGITTQYVTGMLTEELAQMTLHKMKENSATGPDGLPALFLKNCAQVLALPLLILAHIILRDGRWPQLWTTHWIAPIFKRNVVFKAKNYRGVHLTAQLSKAMERLIGTLFLPYLVRTVAYGPNQFAYTPELGSRDAIAHLVMELIYGFMQKLKFLIYCSDVSGAFDKVDAEQMVRELRQKGVHPVLVAVLESWLRDRTAVVNVAGGRSAVSRLANMVYQGTCWGPALWNVYYESARGAINELDFKEIIYADDLNAYRAFPLATENEALMQSGLKCQNNLHEWGRAKRVEFDPAKESMHVVAHQRGVGGDFKILGVVFDVCLKMDACVVELVRACGWKSRSLLRCKRFYPTGQMVNLYKSQILSYIEHRTAGIYHATDTTLAPLEKMQTRYLREIGVDELTALNEFNLAPLKLRRDIAVLGLIHRAVLGKGPAQLRRWFVHAAPNGARTRQSLTRHTKQLQSYREGSFLEITRRSIFGAIDIYNMLPESTVHTKNVKEFQAELQKMSKLVSMENSNWDVLFSPRLPLTGHPVWSYRDILPVKRRRLDPDCEL